jgi:hypothetical protein
MRKYMFVFPNTGVESELRFINLFKGIKEYYPSKEVHERPYVLYINIADPNSDNFNISEEFKRVLDFSKEHEFNYKVQFKGKEYYNNITALNFNGLCNLIRKEINFIKPNILYIPNVLSLNASSSFLGKACVVANTISKYPVQKEKIVCYYYKELCPLLYGQHRIEGNFYILNTEVF